VSVEDGGVYAHAERMYAGAARGRLATVGIPGNHEYGWDWAYPQIAARLAGIFEIELPRPRTVDMIFEPEFIALIPEIKRVVETGAGHTVEVE